MQRLMATMHLSQYIMQPIMILVILLTPPLLMAHSLQQLNLGVLGMAVWVRRWSSSSANRRFTSIGRSACFQVVPAAAW